MNREMQSIRVFAAFSVVAFLYAQDAPPGGSVEGTVINTLTGTGVAGASVFVNGSKRYQTTTDAAGHFKITGMTPGSYRTSTEKDGFASLVPDPRTLLSSEWRVVSGGDPVKVELKLTPLDSIRGRVFGPDGKPAEGVDVSVIPNITADNAVTDKEGRFTLEDLRPGSYTLVAKPPKSARPETPSDANTRTAMVNTYYPSAVDASLAQQIVLRGDRLGDFEIHMQTAAVYRVSGVVLDESGKPSPGAFLSLMRIPEDTSRTGHPMGLIRPEGVIFFMGVQRRLTGEPDATAVTGENGHFEFPAVRSGNWRIEAESDPIHDEQTRAVVSARGGIDTLLGRSDVQDLEIHLTPPFKLNGTVEWRSDDTGNPRPSNPAIVPGIVILMNADTSEFVGTGAAQPGKLLFEDVLPGRYKLIFKPGLIAQVFLGEYEVTGQAFSVAAGGPALRIVLKTWSGTVRGAVERGEGATVVLIPQKVDGTAIGQTVTCGAGESFELSEVSPGDYYIAAFDRLDDVTPSAALLSLVRSRGTSVRVDERTSTSVTLSPIVTPR